MAENGQGSGGGNNIDPKVAGDVAKSMQAVRQSALDASKAFSDQIQILSQLQNSMQAMAGSMRGICDSSDRCFSPDKWKKVTAAASATEKQFNKTQDATEKLAKVLQSRLAKALTVTSGVLDGLGQGFRNLFSILKGIGGVVGGVVGGIFSIGKAILSIPFKILGSLTDMAASGGGGNELAEAYEKVRKEFGAFTSVSSKAIISTSKELKGFNDTGLNSYMIFGNLAQRLQYMTELAQGMGAQFAKHADEFRNNGGALLAYQKGLGITAEQMGVIAGKADQMGVKVGDVLKDMTKQSLHMAKAFGLDAKVISKDMAKAMADVKNFGHLSSQELATAVTYSNKLGVSIEKLTGLMDAFDTFDAAAENTSKLNEQFGLNIDAQEIMSAQDPAKKMELLRKEFVRTGKDMSKLSYQERKLIQQTTGMDAATMDAMFAQKDTADMYKKVATESDKASKAAITQAQALKKLADQIERMTPSGGDLKQGGFLANILQGFEDGIKLTPEFQGMLRNLRASLREAVMFGRKLGKTFVEAFPGVKDILGGLKDLFDPKRIRGFFNDILKVIDDFKTGKIKTFDELMTKLKDVFFSFFDKESGPGKKVMDGFKKFGEALLSIIGMAADWVIRKLADIIDSIVEWIQKPKIPKAAGGIGDALLTPMEKAFNSLTEKLLPALGRLAMAIFEKLKDALLNSKEGHGILGTVIGIVVGPAILRGLVSAASAGLFNAAGKAILVGLAGGVKKAGSGGGEDALCKQFSELQGKCKPGEGAGPGGVADAAGQALPSRQATDSMESASKSKIDWGKLGTFIIGLTAVMLLMAGLFTAILYLVKNVPIEEIIKASIVFGAIALSLLPAGLMIKVLGSIGKVDGASLVKTLLAMAAVLAVGTLAFLGALSLVREMDIKVSDLLMTVGVFMAMVPMFLAAALVTAAAALVGKIVKDPASLVTGLLAIGAVLLAMGATALIVGGIAALVSPENMLAGAKAMEAMGVAFLAAGAITLIAIGIGAILLASSIFGGGALVAGLTAMAAVITSMGTSIVAIMTALEAIKEDPVAVKLKSEAFAAIMLSIASFVEKIGNILDAIPMFTPPKDVIKIIEEISKMINVLINGPDGQGGINAMMRTIVAGLADMTPDKVEGMKAFAAILTAVGSIIGAIGTAVAGIIDKSYTWIDSLTGSSGDNISKGMGGATAFMDAVLPKINDFMNSIKNFMSEAASMPNIQHAGPAIGGIFQALSSLLQVTVPDMSKFQKTVETTTDDWFGKTTYKTIEVDTLALQTLEAYVTTVLGQAAAMLPNMRTIITAVVAELRNLTPSQIKGLAPLAEIIKAISGFMGSMAESAKGAPINVDLKDALMTTVNIQSSAPDLNAIMRTAVTTIPEVVDKIIQLTNKIPAGLDGKALEEKLKLIKSAFDAMGAISTIPKILNDVMAFWKADGSKHHGGITWAKYFYDYIFSEVRDILAMLYTNATGLESIMRYIKLIGYGIPDSAAEDIKKFKKVVVVFGLIGKMMEFMTKTISDVASTGSGTDSSQRFVERVLNPMGNILKALVYGNLDGKETYSLAEILEKMKSLSSTAESSGVDISSIKKMVKVMKGIGIFIGSIATDLLGGISASGGSKLAGFQEAWAPVSDVFRILIGSESGKGPPFMSLTKIVEGLTKIGEKMGEYKPMGKGLSSFVADIKLLLNAMSSIVDPIKNIQSNISSFEKLPSTISTLSSVQTQIQGIFEKWPGVEGGEKGSGGKGAKGQARAVIDTVKGMVKAVQEIDTLLGQGTKIDIKAKLDKFASAMGLGTSGVYTVNSKEVILKVNLTVTMAAGDVEHVIINRKESVIRDRINHLMETDQKDQKTPGADLYISDSRRQSTYFNGEHP